MPSPLDQRPVVVALAGPNGAGKTTFYPSHLRSAGLRLINADVIAHELNIDAYEAARITGAIRTELLRQRESFVFETVFSDPVGDKLSFLDEAARSGYTVLLCFIGLSSPKISNQRVAMRVSQGGHDVPTEKLFARYPRILEKHRSALRDLPHGWVFDNDDLRTSYRLVATCEAGRIARLHRPVPSWLSPLLPSNLK